MSMVFPGSASGEECARQCRKPKRLGFNSWVGKISWSRRSGFNPWLGKIPRERNGNPLQCSHSGNPMDRGAWRATVHGGHKRV